MFDNWQDTWEWLRIEWLEQTIPALQNLGQTFSNVFEWIRKEWTEQFIPALQTVGKLFSTTFTKTDTTGIDEVHKKFQPLTSLFETVGKILSWLGQVFVALMPIFGKIASIVAPAIGKLGEGILTGLQNLDFNTIFGALNTGMLAALVLAFKGFIDKGSGALSGVTGILDGVKGSLQAWQASLKAKTLMTIATAVGILALSLIGLSLVDPGKLTFAIGSIGGMFAGLTLAMGEINKQSNNTKGVATLSTEMVAMAAALLIMSLAVAKLASIDHDKMFNGLVGIGIMLTEIGLFLKATNTKGGVGKTTSLLELAIAVNVLGFAVGKFGELDPKVLLQGLVGMGVVLTELALFIKMTGNAKGVVSTAIGMTILGAAMLILASAIEKMGSMSLETIGKGLLTMAVSLGIIAIAFKAMPKNLILLAPGFLVIAGALVILATALKSMGGMSWEEIGKGLVALAGSMLILALALKAMKGTLDGAAAMLVMAAALAILVPVLQALGDMSLEEIGTALLTLAGVFVIVGVAGLVLGPLTPVIIALAGAIALFGIAALAVGVGILAFSAGLAALSVTGTAGAIALTLIITTLVGLIPVLVLGLANGIIQFAELIAKASPVLVAALMALFNELVNSIVNEIPTLAQTVLTLVVTLLQTLADNAPKIIQAGFDILMALLKGIRDNIKQIVGAVLMIVGEFLEGISNNLDPVVQGAFKLLLKFIESLTEGVKKYGAEILTAGANFVGAIITAVITALVNGVQTVINAIGDFGTSILNGFKNILGIQHSPSEETKVMGDDLVEGLVVGINRSADNAVAAAKGVGLDIVNQIADSINSNMDFNPTIRPVVDLSDVVASGQRINGLFASSSLNVSGLTSRLPVISTGIQAIVNGASQSNNVPAPSQPPSISLQQNNYSPVALSAIDIYRNTQNQLRSLKGLVKS